jgi:hypothetical protein
MSITLKLSHASNSVVCLFSMTLLPGAFVGCAKRWRFVGEDAAPPPLDTLMSKSAFESAMHTRQGLKHVHLSA